MAKNIYKKVLYDFQKKAVDKLLPLDKHLLALDMGLGKTLTSLSIMQLRFKVMKIKKGLILCQKSKVEDWEDEVNKFFPKCKILILDNSQFKKSTIKNVAPFLKFSDIPDNADDRKRVLANLLKKENLIIISTYQVARNNESFLKNALVKKGKWVNVFNEDVMMIIDESQKMKSRTSLIGIWGLEVSKNIRYITLLSGDPISNSYLDLFQQMKILGMKDNWYQWTNKYCVFEKQKGYQKGWTRIVGFKNTGTLMNEVRGKSVFMKTEDCIELPSQIIRNIKLLGSNYLYDSVLSNREYFGEKFKNPIELYLSLRTIAGGFINDNILKSNDKVNYIINLLESTNDKFVIFYNFNMELKILLECLEEKGLTIFQINGKKNEYKVAKNHSKQCVLLIQYKSGSEGLDLQNFNRMIFYSPTTSAGEYKQALKRIHRVGQTNKCFYYKLISIGTIEEKITEANLKGVDYTYDLFRKDYRYDPFQMMNYFKKKKQKSREYKEKKRFLRMKYEYENSKL